MPLLVPDTERKFPIQSIDYLDLDVNDLFEEALQVKRGSCPNWTDESETDFGIQLLWLFSVLSRWMADHGERIKDNTFIGTGRDRQTMRRLCELIGYTLSEVSPASVTVTFTCEDGHPEFTIPAGTQVSTKEYADQPAIMFETDSAALVPVGIDTKNVDCTQGETIADEILGSSDGTTGQTFILVQKPVIWESEVVKIFDGVTWNTWTRVASFVDSGPSDEHYRIEVDEDQNYSIVFGDGENGQIPIRGTNNVKATYRKGEGTSGNVEPNTITELISAVNYVESVNNGRAASGGVDRETLNHARLFGPGTLKALDRAVTVEDMETLAETFHSAVYGGIAKAKAFEVGGVSSIVMVVPKKGGYPSAGLKSALLTHLNERRMICTAIQVADPNYRLVDIEVTVYTFGNYSPSQVAGEVRANLVSYLSPVYQDPETGLYPHGFGRNVYLSDLYRIIDATQGVDHCSISTPSANVTIQEYQIVDIGTIDIIVSTPDGHFSFYDLNKEL